MPVVKIVLLVAAALGLFKFLPALFLANQASPLGLGVCLLAVFYLGLIAGEALEFCSDRVNLYRKL